MGVADNRLHKSPTDLAEVRPEASVDPSDLIKAKEGLASVVHQIHAGRCRAG